MAMIIRVPLASNLYKCPKPWINFIEHCQDTVPKDQYIERYVDHVLLTRYLSVFDDEEECVKFTDESLYTLFMLEWT